jgi:hypothetical protein
MPGYGNVSYEESLDSVLVCHGYGFLGHRFTTQLCVIADTTEPYEIKETTSPTPAIQISAPPTTALYTHSSTNPSH